MRTINKLSIIAICMALAAVLIWGPPVSASAADRGQGVSADQLPEELRALTVQKQFMPGEGAPVGKVRTVRGHIVVRHGNSSEAYFAARGDNLYAHDEIFTLSKSRCRIRYTTADIVTMGANSRIRVDEIMDDRAAKQKKTRMSMLRGKAMFYVMRLMKYNKVDTEVRTPTAVCGVRGTKFGVIIEEKTGLLSMDGMPLYLADASGNPLRDLLAANEGGSIQTTVITYDGTVMVFSTRDGTSQNVGAGQSVTVGPDGAGPVGPADPAQSQGLDDDTNPDGNSGSGDGDDGGGDTGGDAGTSGDSEAGATDAANTLTQQSLQEIQRPTQRIGYFAGMLTKISEWGSTLNPPEFDNIYVSPTMHDHEAPGIVGTSLNYGTTEIVFDGAPDASPVAVKVEPLLNYPPPLTTANGLGPEHQTKYYELGYNQYLEWGWWIMDTPMTDGAYGTWVIDNAGVYVHGDPTPPENLNGITGHYAGTAWGTIWSSAGTPGILMQGTMSADVALGSTILRNLNVAVTDGGSNSVSIQQLADTPFDSSGTANLTQYNNMNVNINGHAANFGAGSVGLFGPNGEGMAGVVGAVSSTEIEVLSTVVGFEGSNVGPPAAPSYPSPPTAPALDILD